jgi:hypothetical protein
MQSKDDHLAGSIGCPRQSTRPGLGWHAVSGRRGHCTRQLTLYECTAYAAVMLAQWRCARVEDVHELALGMPHVKVEHGPSGNPVYQVGGKSFVFFATLAPTPSTLRPGSATRT